MGGKGGKGKGKGKGSSGKGVKGSKGSKGAKGTPAKGKAAKKPSATKKSRGVGDGVPRRLKQHDDVSLTSGEMSDDNQMIEDDEDIDSDMAFGSSDEGLKKMFEDLEEKRATRSKGGKKKTPAPEEERIYASDESVDEGSDSSSEGDNDMINLSDLLDGKEAATKKSSYKPKVIETRKESEFESSSLRTVERPDLQDLIASLNVTEDRDAQSAKRLQKSLSKLSKSEDTSKLIQTPEEQYEKDTRERKLAAEGVEKELDQWNPTIRENRKREFSKYPLPEPNPIQKPNTSTAGITATPSTDMEKEIASMLTSAGLRSDEPEEEIKTSDFVKLQNDVFQLVDKDSDANTTVSRLKNVMSYEHEKKKRVKKIKSKIYRRMLRKEKEKSKDKKLELLALVDPEAALKKKKEEMMKLRAETRMNVRHKNKSQWMKNMKAMAKFDKGAQNALSADSRNRQQLLKKMDETVEDAQYNKGGSGSDDGYSSDSDGVETKEIDTLMSAGGKSDIFSKLRDEVNTDGPKKKGLFAMKFMQRSEQNDKAVCILSTYCMSHISHITSTPLCEAQHHSTPPHPTPPSGLIAPNRQPGRRGRQLPRRVCNSTLTITALHFGITKKSGAHSLQFSKNCSCHLHLHNALHFNIKPCTYFFQHHLATERSPTPVRRQTPRRARRCVSRRSRRSAVSASAVRATLLRHSAPRGRRCGMLGQPQ